METVKLSREEREKYQSIISERLPQILKLDPTIAIVLRDKAYTMELDNKAAKDIFKDTGVNLLGDGLAIKDLNPNLVGSIMFRSLQRHHKDVTQEFVDSVIEFKKYLYIRDKILQAIEMFFPDVSDITPKQEEKSENPQ